MNYIRLNPQYIIRNEKCCSYIVKLEQQVDTDVQGNSGNIFVVPPVVGFIISEIGKNTTTAENGGYPPTQNGDIRSLFWLFSLMALQN